MQSVVAQKYPLVAAGQPVTLFTSHHPDYPDGGQMRDFIYVDDCVNVMLWLLDHRQRQRPVQSRAGQGPKLRRSGACDGGGGRRAARIEFIPMPEAIRPNYQYFTEARMDRLRAAGYTRRSRRWRMAYAQYVERFLSARTVIAEPVRCACGQACDSRPGRRPERRSAGRGYVTSPDAMALDPRRPRGAGDDEPRGRARLGGHQSVGRRSGAHDTGGPRRRACPHDPRGKLAGGSIDGVFVCPHAPDDGCDCRKPAPGLIRAAIAASGIDAGRPWWLATIFAISKRRVRQASPRRSY